MNNVYKNKGFFEVSLEEGVNFVLLADRRNIEKMMIEDIDAFILQLKANADMLEGKISNNIYFFNVGPICSHEFVLDLISSEMEPFKLEYGVISAKNPNLKHYNYLGKFSPADQFLYEVEYIDYISRETSDGKKYALCCLNL